MDQQTLMQRMILAGVNVHNPQEVFDFYHSHYQGDGGGGIDLVQLRSLVDVWIFEGTANKPTKIEVDQALLLKANLADLEAFQRNAATKVQFDQLEQQKADQADLEAIQQQKADQADLERLDHEKANLEAVNQQLSTKLNRSEFQQHFRGLFSSIDALATGVLNPVSGDYANVDAGPGHATEIYAYDVDDAIWRKQGSNGVSVTSTDSVPEGNVNLYHTAERVEHVVKGMSTTDLPEGVNQYYTPDRVRSTVKGMSTTDLPEGVNQYYTDARVDARIQLALGPVDSLLDQILGG